MILFYHEERIRGNNEPDYPNISPSKADFEKANEHNV